jgi:hypothetical protein
MWQRRMQGRIIHEKKAIIYNHCCTGDKTYYKLTFGYIAYHKSLFCRFQSNIIANLEFNLNNWHNRMSNDDVTMMVIINSQINGRALFMCLGAREAIVLPLRAACSSRCTDRFGHASGIKKK